jgi:chromate transporter
VAGGVCFILPAMLLVLALAAAYRRYGRLPDAQWLLYGVKPVIVAIVVQALWGLAGQALRTPRAAVVAGAVVALSL